MINMGNKSSNEKFYQTTPLEKIPWCRVQDDWFQELLDSGKLGRGDALDLGCGVGAKSIALAEKGFKVTGVDISATAIEYARQKATKAQQEICFFDADATDLSFLGDKKFDLILDWAALHGIPKSKRKRYVKGIADRCKTGGMLLLRCWSKTGISRMQIGFLTSTGLYYFFSKKDITDLFESKFKIVEVHRSKPFEFPGERPPAVWLDEYLMERK